MFSLVFLSFSLRLQAGSSFLLQGSCPVRPPCYCADDTLNCAGRDLTSFPHFYSTNLNFPSLSILLYGNKLRTIPANAFLNLDPKNGTFIKLDLSDNQITHIDVNAFAGIENEVGLLHLGENELYTLPKVIAKLKNLQNLHLEDNPLISLDSFVINGISISLRSLRLSLRYFTSWPRELKLFTSLENLNIAVNDIGVDDDAFAGSMNTLKRLTIEDSFYDYIPKAVCSLQVLENLVLDYDDFDNDGNRNADKNTTFRPEMLPCDIQTLEYLSLQDSYSFSSKIFTRIPSLNHFQLSSPHSGHSTIDNKYIPFNSSMTILQLIDCGYVSFPGEVNSFSVLTELDLRQNNIRAINEHDLAGLRELESLTLEKNPLVYISANAFVNNNNLQVLNLASTDISAIPASVTTLHSLQILTLAETSLRCDCTTMSNVTTWMVKGITITGLCDKSDPGNSEMIKTYITTSLLSCP